MHLTLVVLGALTVTALAALGLVAIVTGWLLPWHRSRVLRPRLSGLGTLLCAVGAGLFMFLGPFMGPPHGERGDVAWGGWVTFMVGLGVGFLAQRPGRTPGPTKTAS
ncbi:hypothetical protein ACIO93_25695 [Streptomyces sp. NPDC087903]|uniref:hypothetical protein n=1 Tax=Streptomyces sp. NPDC087903 TaxID=3365819 RepID=UPI00382765E9